MLMCMHGVCCGVGGCNVVATEHGMYSLSCMEKLHVSSDGSYGMLGV